MTVASARLVVDASGLPFRRGALPAGGDRAQPAGGARPGCWPRACSARRPGTTSSSRRSIRSSSDRSTTSCSLSPPIGVSLVAGQLTSRIRAQSRNRADAGGAGHRALPPHARPGGGEDPGRRGLSRRARAGGRTLRGADLPRPGGRGRRGSRRILPAPYVLEGEGAGGRRLGLPRPRTAGRFTDTLPASTGYYVPLLREDGAVGVLGIRRPPEEVLTLAQRDLIEVFCAAQLALERGKRDLAGPPASRRSCWRNRRSCTTRCSMACPTSCARPWP